MSSKTRVPLKHAVVIKGPMQSFTRAFIAHYLAAMPLVGVVFSHNNGTAGSTREMPFLERTAAEHPINFAFVLREPPPDLGRGFRNAQREACYHGVRLAIDLWHPKWLLVHRPDRAFVMPHVRAGPNRTVPLFGGAGLNVMERLAAVAIEQPPPVGVPPRLLRHRLGLCPRIALHTRHGRFNLDDHCLYGRAEDVANFWSLEAPYYCRECDTSAAGLNADTLGFEPNVSGTRPRNCPVPSPETENAVMWVDQLARHGVPPPRSNLELIRERR